MLSVILAAANTDTLACSLKRSVRITCISFVLYSYAVLTTGCLGLGDSTENKVCLEAAIVCALLATTDCVVVRVFSTGVGCTKESSSRLPINVSLVCASCA